MVNNRQQDNSLGISTANLEAIIVRGDGQTLVTKAEVAGRKLGGQDGLTTNQIRAIFGTVRQIDMNWTKNPQGATYQLQLLKPKMQYRAAREKNNSGKGLKSLADVLGDGIDLITKAEGDEARQRFIHFLDFFEAILAFHKVATEEQKNEKGKKRSHTHGRRN